MRRRNVGILLGVLTMGTAVRAQRNVVTEVRGTELDARSVQTLWARPVTVVLDHRSLAEAIDAVTASAGVAALYHAEVVNAVRKTVTVRLTHVSLGQALDQLLAATPLMAVPITATKVGIVMTDQGAERGPSGSINGRVTDAATKQPLRGATVFVDDAAQGVTTDAGGAFRIFGIVAGSHRVTIRLLGHARQVQTVMVADGEAVTLNVALLANANTLDQVVVTGTIIPTVLKAVPNAITIITANQIEERGITHIDQLFRGDVPGLFAQNLGSGTLLDEVTMFSRGGTALSDVSAGVDPNIGTTNPIKTYIDGVELADPRYLSQIDPRSIERIEILTGPQASTIYGSNAINGVMQIFTKRGSTSHPQLTLNLLSGWIKNNFSSARTPQHDYSTQLNGIEGRLSYNAGGSWNYMGPWTPAKQTARLDGFGGVIFKIPSPFGRVTADVTFRRSTTQTRQRGTQFQTVTNDRETGWYNNLSASGLNAPTLSTLTGQTLGGTLGYAPTDWWSHEFGWGTDMSDTETRSLALGYLSRADTMLQLQQNHAERRSLRYTTILRVPATESVNATLTLGADAWQNLVTSWSVSSQTLTGSLAGSTSVTRQPGHNTGSFVQTQLGVRDRLFLTYGLRAEWNPDYGAEVRPNYAPRYGVAYTQEVTTPLGLVTTKLRGSYGRSTRPPQPKLKAAITAADYYGASNWSSISIDYAPFDVYLANPDLGPEYQQGGEGGIELYFGTRGSLVVTRYNQTVDGLIASPNVDSVRSLTQGPSSFSNLGSDGYGYWWQFQYLNLGSIRNQGWEVQGSVNAGPLTTRGVYSWTKSRVIGIAPKYRDYFANNPQYQSGATFQYLPEHTWSLGSTYADRRVTIGLNITGIGKIMNALDDFYLQHLVSNIRLLQNRQSVTAGQYVNINRGYALADLTASYRFLSRVEGVLQVQNLMDHYTNDYDAVYATIGRQVKLGARLRTP